MDPTKVEDCSFCLTKAKKIRTYSNGVCEYVCKVCGLKYLVTNPMGFKVIENKENTKRT